MGFRNGAYASVFSVKKGDGNYYEVNLVTSKKNKNSGNYERDFGGFARFIGNAASGIAKFDGKNAKDNGNRPITRIKLGDVETTNSYSKKDGVGKTYTNYVVYSFEYVDGNNGGSTANNQKSMADYVNSTPSISEDESGLFT